MIAHPAATSQGARRRAREHTLTLATLGKVILEVASSCRFDFPLYNRSALKLLLYGPANDCLRGVHVNDAGTTSSRVEVELCSGTSSEKRGLSQVQLPLSLTNIRLEYHFVSLFYMQLILYLDRSFTCAA